MQEVRKIYDCKAIANVGPDVGLLIDEYFEYDKILEAFFNDIMTLADFFDFKKTDEIVKMLDVMDLSDESLIYLSFFLKDKTTDKRLKNRLEVFNIVICNIFHLNKLFNDKGTLLPDELEKVNDRLDLYRGMIYDFSRKLKRVFLG